MIIGIDDINHIPKEHKLWLQEQVLPKDLAECVISLSVPCTCGEREVSDNKRVVYTHRAFDMDKNEMEFCPLTGFERDRGVLTRLLSINTDTIVIMDCVLIACLTIEDCVAPFIDGTNLLPIMDSLVFSLITDLSRLFSINQDYELIRGLLHKWLGGECEIVYGNFGYGGISSEHDSVTLTIPQYRSHDMVSIKFSGDTAIKPLFV